MLESSIEYFDRYFEKGIEDALLRPLDINVKLDDYKFLINGKSVFGHVADCTPPIVSLLQTKR